MEADDLAADDRTFKAEFSAAGIDQLKERMREKLRELKFQDADDSLVDYVTFLLRNGRRKDEANKELYVFLRDDSASFLSWLWDHLSSNLHLYVQTQEHHEVENKEDETPKEVSGRQNSSDVRSRIKGLTHPGHTSESSTTTRSRNRRELKGVARENENFPLRSVLTDILHGEEKKPQKSTELRHLPSSNQRNGGKRDREDEPQETKRELPCRPVLGASQRLLQFAVRDAVKAVQQTGSSTEPSSKRLRSVVSTSADNLLRKKPEISTDCLHDRRSGRSTDNLHNRRSERSTDNLNDKRSERRTRQILQVPGAALAFKAAAEAAADSSKVRSTGSVFRRLGQGNDVNQSSCSREVQRNYEDSEPVTTVGDHDSDRSDDNDISGDLNIVDREAEMNIDSTSDDDVDIDDGMDRYQSSDSHGAALSSVAKKEILTECSVEPETSAPRISSLTNEARPISSSTIKARNTMTVPVNLNTVEPPNYGTPKDVHVVEKLDVTPTNTNVTTLAINVKELGHGEAQKDSQRSTTSVASSYSTAHPTEDADSRTVYVSNVHFAATKDSLSRHFNNFGAVLKVVIVTNAATGQPTGSAYVEFLHKESAERALSLNGTSFMTRLLKVVRRSSHEAAHFYGWPGSGRSSLYPRHSRMAGRGMAYPRGILPGSSFRGRGPMKAGARSLQWKREPSGTESNAGAKPAMTVALSSAEQILPPAT